MSSGSLSRPRGLIRLVAGAALAVLVAGCVFAPRTIHVYDPDCQITSRQMILQAEQMPVFGHCRGEQCGAMLVIFGAVSAATAVVSGSIVVVGNVVYWFEKQNDCKRVEAAK
ncbi:MAG: hypothetical protein IPG93_07750 [Burkholderiales bacterium]|nr:hypothetical protein [Burkholderiales bacterium]